MARFISGELIRPANEIQLKTIMEDEFGQWIMGNVVLDGMAMNKRRVALWWTTRALQLVSFYQLI